MSAGNRSCGGVTWTLTFDQRRWEVNCSCGFAVFEIGSREAAKDTAAWHRGASSTPLGDSPWSFGDPWPPGER